MMALGIFVRGSLKDLNYTKLKKDITKISTSPKKKKLQIYEILWFLSTNKEKKKKKKDW